MRESAIEKYLHQQVRKAGGDTRKWVCPGRRGVPDRIVMWPPRVTQNDPQTDFVETKAPDGRLEPWQKREHKRLRDMGFVVRVIWTKEQVDSYVA